MNDKSNESNFRSHLILILMSFIALGPVIILFFNSLKNNAEIGSNPLGFPSRLTFENYFGAWETANYSTTIWNSFLISGGTVVGVIIVAGLGAFALSRLKLKGSDILTFYFLVGTSVPAQLFIVPLFIMWRDIGLYNTYAGIILIYIGLFSPFSTYLLRSYMLSIPEDFVEAARLDGASNFVIFYRIILPLSWPGFLTVALVVGLWSWNEFLFALTFLPEADMKPVSTGLFAFQSRYSRDWGLTNAASMIMTIPIVILFLLLQKKFIEGLTQGGLKA